MANRTCHIALRRPTGEEALTGGSSEARGRQSPLASAAIWAVAAIVAAARAEAGPGSASLHSNRGSGGKCGSSEAGGGSRVSGGCGI